MVLDPIPQSLPVHFFGSRPQPPTSCRMEVSTHTYHIIVLSLIRITSLICVAFICHVIRMRVTWCDTYECSEHSSVSYHCVITHTYHIAHMCCIMSCNTYARYVMWHVWVLWARIRIISLCYHSYVSHRSYVCIIQMWHIRMRRMMRLSRDTWFYVMSYACPPAPMNHVKIKGWPPRDAPSKLVQLWYKTFPSDQCGQREMKKPTILSNKTSIAWSCAEDQIRRFWRIKISGTWF